MKSVVVIASEPKETSYPRLKKFTSADERFGSYIVLFERRNTGTIVWVDPTSRKDIGYHASDFCEDAFETLPPGSTVTLQQ